MPRMWRHISTLASQCHNCNQWNTFVEELKSDPKKTPNSRAGFAGSISKATSLSAIKGKKHSRVSTHIGEFDRVLGGGIVKGSVTLVGGVSQVRESSAYITQIAKQVFNRSCNKIM